MSHYQPHIQDMQFVLSYVLNAPDQLKSLQVFEELDGELVQQVLEEAGKFVGEVVAPLNRDGDEIGAQCQDGKVTMPPGFQAAYQMFWQAGWPALSADTEDGGQGLPTVLEIMLYEMLSAANHGWTMAPGLLHGAYECIKHYASPSLKETYLSKVSTGEWLATMCLTEPHAGSDLGLSRTKATPQADGRYALNGTKIFISGGEHDLTDNIVHLVLARLPDAPPGPKGLSLFLVPKFYPNGERSAVHCDRIEEKMGLHGSPTCVMRFDDALAEIIGEPGKGLNAMFVMMNAARIGVGMQSLGLTEVAYQNALAYAKERIQSRSLSGVKQPSQPADGILVHPDVRKMLLTAKAYAEGGRALNLYCALLIDQELNHPNAAVRQQAADMVAMLTPIVKAFITDNGWTATSSCLQVLGGHGFISEWGMEQYVRDARINMIYEGTNTIQSLDLLGRKVLGNQGETLKKFGQMIAELVAAESGHEEMTPFIQPLAKLAQQMTSFTGEIGMKAMANADEVGAAAVDYLRVAGHLVFGYFWARMAQVALQQISAGSNDPFYKAKVQTARFYFSRLFPETASLMLTARSGSEVLMDTDAVFA